MATKFNYYRIRAVPIENNNITYFRNKHKLKKQGKEDNNDNGEKRKAGKKR